MNHLELIHRSPEGEARPTPVLFIHGAWHGAWCWDEYFLSYFTQCGYHSYALSLRGHGKSAGHEHLRWSGAADFVADVEQVVQGLPAAPVIVAHSMGGFVLQKYLEKHSAPAAVLLASIPPSGSILFVLRALRRYPLAVIKAVLTLRLYPVMETAEMAQHWCFSPDLPPDKVAAYHAQIGDESFRMLLDTLLLNLPRPARVRQNGTPLLVLGAENDRIFSTAEVRATAKAYGTEAEFFPNMAHDMMLEAGWQTVADRILGWLGERGL
jgi:pimeloyl-ACP methyl ester carboxylesterase